MRRLAVLLSLLSLVATAPIAAAQTAPSQERIDEAERAVERLEGEAASADDRVSDAEGRLDEIDDRLVAAQTALAEADAAADTAQRAADEALADAIQARRRLDRSRDELARNDRILAEVARDSYKRGPASTTPTMAVLGSMTSRERGPEDLADTLHVIGRILDGKADVVERSRTLVAQTAALADEADAADAAAQQQLAAAEAARDDAGRRHAEVLALLQEATAGVEQARIEQASATEALATAQEELATLRDRKREAEEAAAARRRAQERRELGGGLVRVGGITVHESLADDLARLLADARADGIVLGGYGYRSPETTVRLRRVNGCPDVHSSPASSCRVPTARPGESMHERGLAVDFTYQGRTLCYPRSPSRCHGNPAFDWLQANAHRYGLKVLSTEAWHWSTNGN